MSWAEIKSSINRDIGVSQNQCIIDNIREDITLPFSLRNNHLSAVYNSLYDSIDALSDDKILYRYRNQKWTKLTNNVAPEVNNGCLVHYKDKTILMSGVYFYAFNEADGTWSTVGTSTSSNSNCGAITYNECIHKFGGTNSTKIHEKWDGSSWTTVSTLPYDFINASVVVYKSSIYVIGLKSVEKVLYRLDGTTWTALASAPVTNNPTGMCLVVIDDSIHIISDIPNLINYKYDATSNTWSYIGSKYINTTDTNIQCTVYNGKLNLVGTSSNIHYIYDDIADWVDDNTIYSGSNNFSSFIGSACATLNKAIHIFGQEKSSAGTVKHGIYTDTSIGSSFKISTDIPYTFRYGKAITYHNSIHLIGSSDNLTNHYRWTDNGVWTSVSTLPYNFMNGSVVIYHDEIHILGSETNTSHYKWNDNTYTWVSVSTLPYEFFRGEAFVYHDKIHICSGGTTGNANNFKFYQWDGTSWTALTNVPYNAKNCMEAVDTINNTIHIIGGSEVAVSYHYIWDGVNWIYSGIAPRVINNIPVSMSIDKTKIIVFGCSNDIISNIKYLNYNHFPSVKGALITTNKAFGKPVRYQSSELSSHSAETVGDLPYEFYGGHAVLLNNDIHIFGKKYVEATDYMCYYHYRFNGYGWIKMNDTPIAIIETSDAVAHNGEIHIFSGMTKTGLWHYKWNSILDSWTSVSTPPTNYFKVVVLNNIIQLLSYTEHYSWNGSTWTSVSKPPSIFPEYLVVFGNIIHCFKNAHHYSWDGTTWTSATITSVGTGQLVIHNNKIQLLSDTNDPYHYIWDETNLKWTIKNAVPYICTKACFVNDNIDKLHILGGYRVYMDPVSYEDAYVIDNSNNHLIWNDELDWSISSIMPISIINHTSVVYGGEIHIMGGDSTQHYKWNGTTWTSVSTLPYVASYLQCIIFMGAIEIIGSDKSPYNQHYRWDGSTWTALTVVPYQYSAGSCTLIDNAVHIFGTSINELHNQHYKWNGTTWTSVSTLPYDATWNNTE